MPRLPVHAPRSGIASMSPVGVTRLRAGVTMSYARPSLVDSRLSSHWRGVEVWQGYQALGLGAWSGPPGYLGLDAAREDTTARQLAALPGASG
jgi:hypothetical protein